MSALCLPEGAVEHLSAARATAGLYRSCTNMLLLLPPPVQYLSQLCTALQFLRELDTEEEAKARAREANSVFAEVLREDKKGDRQGKYWGR